MCLIANIIFLIVIMIGRIVMYYRLTGKWGLENFSFDSIYSLFISTILTIGWLGIFVLSILDYYQYLHPQYKFGFVGDIIGWIIFGFGLIMASKGQAQMGVSWQFAGSNSDDTELITHGLFQYSRNPIYTGVIVSFIGCIFLFPHHLMVMFFSFLYLSIDAKIRYIEEPHLKKVHGFEYEEYCKQVNRFFPLSF